MMSSTTVRLMLVVLLLGLGTAKVLALATEHFGNAPMPPGWGEQLVPRDLVPLANHPSRIYWREINGDPQFFYQGNTATLNEAVKLFAGKGPCEIVLLPGPDEVTSLVGEKRMRCDWDFHPPGGLFASRAEKEKGTNVIAKVPTLTIYVGVAPPDKPADAKQLQSFMAELDNGEFAVRARAAKELEKLANAAGPALQKALADKPSAEKRKQIEALLQKLDGIDLQQLKIPEGIKVIGVEELRERYLQGLKSEDSEIRGHSVGGLGRIDKYGEDVMPMLLELLKNEKHEWVRRCVASVLCHVGPKGKAALPLLKAGLDDPDPNVRNFYQYAIDAIEKANQSVPSPQAVAEQAARQKALRVGIAAFVRAREQNAGMTPPRFERTLAKEPAYQGKPRYFFLLFGPRAETRVACVMDGDVLYVDRNGNGDLTEAGEKLPLLPNGLHFESGAGHSYPPTFNLGTITEKDGKTSHKEVWIGRYKSSCSVNGTIRGKFRMYSSIDLGAAADSPQTALYTHFNGPMHAYLFDKELVRRQDQVEVRAAVATCYADKAWAFVGNEKGIPEDAHPLAELTFAGKDGKPIVMNLRLTQRC